MVGQRALVEPVGSRMTFVSGDGREGYLACDHPLCPQTSELFVYSLGGSIPPSWTDSQRFREPGLEGHLCPDHAGLEPG